MGKALLTVLRNLWTSLVEYEFVSRRMRDDAGLAALLGRLAVRELCRTGTTQALELYRLRLLQQKLEAVEEHWLSGRTAPSFRLQSRMVACSYEMDMIDLEIQERKARHAS
jgi:hypothetical protein